MQKYHRTLKIILPLALSTTIMVFSCNNSSKEEQVISGIVSNLLGKEIIFPNDLKHITKDSLVISATDTFKMRPLIVVSIIDGNCSSCILELEAWRQFMDEHKDYSFEYFMIITSNDNHETFKYLLENKKIKTPLCPILLDENSNFLAANGLPYDNRYHTFLIDSESRIILLGNPLQNYKIRELYKKAADRVRAASL